MLYFVQVALVMVSLFSSGTVMEIGKRGSTKASDLISEIKFVFSRSLVYSELLLFWKTHQCWWDGIKVEGTTSEWECQSSWTMVTIVNCEEVPKYGCLGYFSIGVIGHHNQGNLEKKEIIWAHRFKRLEFMTIMTWSMTAVGNAWSSTTTES